MRAAAAVLAYLQQMQPSALSLLTRLHTYTLGEFMTLDEATRRNLELTETMRGGDVKGSLLGVLDDTLTPMGSRLLRRWLNQPLLDVDAINRRLDAVQLLHRRHRAAAGAARQLRTDRRPGALDQPRHAGLALPRDLVGMREVLRQVPALQRLSQLQSGRRTPLAPILPTSASLRSAGAPGRGPCRRAARHLATPGIIRIGFDAELDGLVESSRHAKDWIANLEQVERQRLDIKSLKVGYNKVFGYYIEVTNTHTGQGAARIHPQADDRQRRALHHARPQGVRDAGAQRRRAAAGDRAADLSARCAARSRRTARSCCSWPPALAELDVYAGAGRGGAAAPLRAPRGGRRAGHRDRRRAPSGGGAGADATSRSCPTTPT